MSDICTICLNKIYNCQYTTCCEMKRQINPDYQHNFHRLCIEKWYCTHENCPTCDKQLVKHIKYGRTCYYYHFNFLNKWIKKLYCIRLGGRKLLKNDKNKQKNKKE